MISSIILSSVVLASGPIPKYGEALCVYKDKTENVEFEFYIAKYQNTYDFRHMGRSTYYVTVFPEQEILIVGVAPLKSNGDVDNSKSTVGRAFNTITRDAFHDVRGEQSLACEPL